MSTANDGSQRAVAGTRGTAAPGSSPLSLLARRDFGPYFFGNLLSNSGTFCQAIALSLLAYRLTGSSLWVGVVGFAQFAAVLLLAPWTGAAADRLDRRRLLIATQVGAMAVSAVLALLAARGAAGLGTVIALASLLGVTTSFSFPALKALVPALVPPGDLHHAVTMDSISMNLSKAVGPVAGALVVQHLGIGWAFGLNGLSYLGLIGALMVVRPRPIPVATERVSLRDSLASLRGRPAVLALLAIVAAVAVAQDPATTLAPAFGVRVFHRSATLAGPILGAFGLGACFGGLAVRRPAGRPVRRVVGLLLVMAAACLVFAASSDLTVSLVALATSGFAYLAAQSLATTLLHEQVADDERGRIMAIWSVAFIGSRPVASLVDGSLAILIGLRLAVVAMALPLLAVLPFVGLAEARGRRTAAG